MQIRKYQDGDETALLKIYQSSIRMNAEKYYSLEQLHAWAPETIDIDKWKERMQGICPYIAEEDGEILGYADLQDNGYIDHFFVKGGGAGKGVGRFLMEHILSEASRLSIPRLSADVSLAAQGFFARFGFEIIERKKAIVRGVELDNAKMGLAVKT